MSAQSSWEGRSHHLAELSVCKQNTNHVMERQAAFQLKRMRSATMRGGSQLLSGVYQSNRNWFTTEKKNLMLAVKNFSSNSASVYKGLLCAAVVCSQLECFEEMTKTSVGDYLLVSLLPSSPVTLTSNPAENPVSECYYLASDWIQAIHSRVVLSGLWTVSLL